MKALGPMYPSSGLNGPYGGSRKHTGNQGARSRRKHVRLSWLRRAAGLPDPPLRTSNANNACSCSTLLSYRCSALSAPAACLYMAIAIAACLPLLLAYNAAAEQLFSITLLMLFSTLGEQGFRKTNIWGVNL